MIFQNIFTSLIGKSTKNSHETPLCKRRYRPRLRNLHTFAVRPPARIKGHPLDLHKSQRLQKPLLKQMPFDWFLLLLYNGSWFKQLNYTTSSLVSNENLRLKAFLLDKKDATCHREIRTIGLFSANFLRNKHFPSLTSIIFSIKRLHNSCRRFSWVVKI